MQAILDFLSYYWSYASGVLLSFLDASQRIFYVYVAATVLVAFVVYQIQRKKSRDATGERGSFVAFLFPKSVWQPVGLAGSALFLFS